MITLKNWKKYLDSTAYSENTKQAYYNALVLFSKQYSNTDLKSLKAYKADLLDKYSAQTINLRLIALNKYNSWKGHPDIRVSGVKVAKRPFLENVITSADYLFLCSVLKSQDLEMYFLVRFLGATGARISEVMKFKGEAIQLGYLDILGKGRKLRRIYIPKLLQTEALTWKTTGLLFTLPYYRIRLNFQSYAKLYGLDPKILHPHSFRHFFALSFIEKYQDLALLADLLGHDSIETTRIYLRRTSAQQKAIVDKVVTW